MKKTTFWLAFSFTLLLAYIAVADTSLHSYLTGITPAKALSGSEAIPATGTNQPEQVLPEAEKTTPPAIADPHQSQSPDRASMTETSPDRIGSVTPVPALPAGDQAVGAQPQPAPPAPASQPKPQPKPKSATSPAAHDKSTQPAGYAQEMLGYINTVRAQNGLSPLTLSSTLCNGAYLKSKDMAVNNYFSHNSPTYGDPFTMMKGQGITYRRAAENIAKNFSVLASHNAFMDSSGHRANILNASFKRVGLGFYQQGSYLYVTQWFTD